MGRDQGNAVAVLLVRNDRQAQACARQLVFLVVVRVDLPRGVGLGRDSLELQMNSGIGSVERRERSKRLAFGPVCHLVIVGLRLAIVPSTLTTLLPGLGDLDGGGHGALESERVGQNIAISGIRLFRLGSQGTAR
jgi:hypothetical protein